MRVRVPPVVSAPREVEIALDDGTVRAVLERVVAHRFVLHEDGRLARVVGRETEAVRDDFLGGGVRRAVVDDDAAQRRVARAERTRRGAENDALTRKVHRCPHLLGDERGEGVVGVHDLEQGRVVHRGDVVG